ncbi:MAG TPA: hypothetical protein VM580_08935, partial [Labilithrix sp.]|nr:hypothetical protein [Labilithrix sp.]
MPEDSKEAEQKGGPLRPDEHEATGEDAGQVAPSASGIGAADEEVEVEVDDADVDVESGVNAP